MTYFKQPTPEELAENRRKAAEKQDNLGRRPGNGYATDVDTEIAILDAQQAKLVKPTAQTEEDKREANRKAAKARQDKLGGGR